MESGNCVFRFGFLEILEFLGLVCLVWEVLELRPSHKQLCAGIS